MKRVLVILCFCLLCVFSILAVRYAYIKTKYPLILENIEAKRMEFLRSYRLVKSDEEKEKVIDQARSFLNEMLPGKVFPAWYGTPWSFNGDAECPFQGCIACGSFVENVLKHTGFKI